MILVNYIKCKPDIKIVWMKEEFVGDNSTQEAMINHDLSDSGVPLRTS